LQHSVKQKLEGFLKSGRSERREALLKIIPVDRSWSKVKKSIGDVGGGAINCEKLSELLAMLIALSIVEERDGKYVITAPV